ncbi:Interferon-induced very large GTPase 1, partial [Tinamus guttatus]
GLDAAYWLPNLLDILGVKSKEALQHLQYEDYLKLECKVRRSWEKKALLKLMDIEDKKKTGENVPKKRLEVSEKRHKSALKDLKEMQKEIHHTKELKKEEELQKVLDIPQDFLDPPENRMVKVVEKMQKQLEQQEKSACRSATISDEDVLRRASGGLALQGIYRTNCLEDMLAKREQLIKIPEGFQLAGAEQGSVLEKKEFSSAAAEATFTKSMEQLGFSISAASKSMYWNFKFEAALDYSNSSHSVESHQSRSEQAYFCSTKYCYVPVASCYFQRHQLRLSDAALQELRDIEQLLSITPEANQLDMLKSRCGSFFHRFGSHVNQGPLHFGGIFWWKASVEGFRAEEREDMKRQASQALNSYVGASYEYFVFRAAGDVHASHSSSEASFKVKDRKQEKKSILLFVTKTGGPSEVDSLAEWKSGLVNSKATWCVIDRGFQLIPVWDIVLCNHSNNFKSAHQMSSCLRTAYEALTHHSVTMLFGEELVSAVEEARDFLEGVRAWEATVDEKKLLTLIEFKQNLNDKTKNHSIWINKCLSDKTLQQFLVNTVLSCQKSSSENTIYIKSLLRCLLHPHVYSVKDFPQASFIMQWIFHTEHAIPETPSVSEFEDLAETLLQMKGLIQEATYAPEASASAIHEAKIKATLTISLSAHSLLQFLRDRKQKDMELLVLLVTTSTGYRVESNTFQHLLGLPEINFMIKEMQTVHKEYLSLKEQDVYRAEAFLLLTGLTITPDYKELSLEQKYDRLVVMKDQMENSWSTEIKNLLEKHNACKDWEMLERNLHSFVNGCLDDTYDDLKKHRIIKDMEDTFQEIKPSSQSTSKSGQKSCSKSKINEVIANQEFLNLLRRLGLERYYPRKMGTEDFHILYKTSIHDSQPSKDNELTFYFLQKLLMADYRVRYLVCKEKSN